MGALVIVGFVIVVAAIRVAKKRRSPVPRVLSWTESIDVPLPPHRARTVIAKVYRKLGYVLHSAGEEGIDIFTRGDKRIREIPAARPVEWREVPLFAGAATAARGSGTFLTLLVEPLPGITVAADSVQSFLEKVQAEGRIVLGLLRDAINDVQQAHRTVHESPRTDSRATATKTVADDLTMLGLKAGASWQEVQTAYRDACKKYHPDRLTAQNLAPHLVDLAVRQFKEVSAAYERLRNNRPVWTHA